MADTITCTVCGAVNDAANHFCDQCGASLKSAPSSAAGYTSAPPASPDPMSATVQAAPSGDLVCSVCGAAVLPGQAFCDNCGANLIENPPIPASGIPPAYAPTMPDLSQVPLPVAPVMPAASAPTAPDLSQVPLPTDPNADTLVEVLPEDTAAPVAPELPTPPVAPVAPAVPPAPPAAAGSAGGKTRAELETEIERHTASIAQLEQLLALQGGAAPAYLTAALDDARNARMQAEAALATLTPPALPAPDPAEVARLTAEVERHTASIAQLEQLLALQGGAAPAYLTAALDDARNARMQAEVVLQELLAGTASSAVAVALVTPPAPPAPLTPIEPPAPVVPHPRLTFADGRVVYLPIDKAEIIVGREDPVSDIYPEVDLTPFGGETGGVSRQHARMNYTDGQWSVTDLSSTNFTKVNGKRLEPNTPEPLQDRAEIHFGRITVTLMLS
ncbi:MAG: FHA domain-containing protein [Chloroflexaceae bacterium]|nr:FHA domain-containing protein [Chloroflexaceae bacterium]